jgi:hypothetical protein
VAPVSHYDHGRLPQPSLQPMSWIEKELKRRAAAQGGSPSTLASHPAAKESARVHELWERIERANAALPLELQLVSEVGDPALPSVAGPRILVWLRAPNGAGIGQAADALRYIWPEPGRRRSHNFWIRWDDASGRYEIHQRANTTVPYRIAYHRFDERRIDHLLECLVVGRRVAVRAIRKKRFGLF